MANRNITLSLPEDTLQAVKIVAVKRNISMSALMAGLLEDLIAEETSYRQAERQFLDLLEQGFDLGTQGEIGWTRGAIHER